MEIERNHVYAVDCLEGLRSMASESVDMCVTSPPYWGLRDYGTNPVVWDAVEGCEHEWREEVTERPNASGGHNSDRLKRKGKDNFQEYVDYKDRTTTSCFCSKCGAWRGELGLEPSPELYVKHLVQVFGEVRRCLKSEGTLWLNLGDSYAGSGKGIGSDHGKAVFTDRDIAKTDWAVSGLKNKDLVGVPWSVAFALRADGWYLRSDIIWHKPNAMPESVRDRPTRGHEYVFLLSKRNEYYYDQDAIREPYALNRWGGRYKTNEDVKNSPSEKRCGGQGSLNRMGFDCYAHEGRNKRTVWTVPTKAYRGAHFATFPEKLIEPCILAGCPKGGLVLDPFMGAGTTASVAQRLGRDYVGYELNPDYHRLISERLSKNCKRLEDFG